MAFNPVHHGIFLWEASFAFPPQFFYLCIYFYLVIFYSFLSSNFSLSLTSSSWSTPLPTTKCCGALGLHPYYSSPIPCSDDLSHSIIHHHTYMVNLVSSALTQRSLLITWPVGQPKWFSQKHLKCSNAKSSIWRYSQNCFSSYATDLR